MRPAALFSGFWPSGDGRQGGVNGRSSGRPHVFHPIAVSSGASWYRPRGVPYVTPFGAPNWLTCESHELGPADRPCGGVFRTGHIRASLDFSQKALRSPYGYKRRCASPLGYARTTPGSRHSRPNFRFFVISSAVPSGADAQDSGADRPEVTRNGPSGDSTYRHERDAQLGSPAPPGMLTCAGKSPQQSI
jgi:hypothetical protein